MDLQILHPERDRSAWQAVLGELRHDVYHLPEYVLLEASRMQSEPEAIVIRQGEGVMFLPYLVRSCCELFPEGEDGENTFDVISPYGYPGVLTSAVADGEFIRSAWAALKGALGDRGVCAAFLRLHPILSQAFVAAVPEAEWSANGQTVSIDLSLTEKEIWSQTRKGHQSAINKTKRLGYEHRIVPAAENFECFWEIYKETMDRVSAQQSYYFSVDYFDRLLSMEEMHLYVTELEGEVVAASLFFECNGIVQMHLAGTRTAHLRNSPFNGLLDHARYWAKERGNAFLHLGGGIGGSIEDSLFIFKSGFSRLRHDFQTVRCVIDPVQYEALVERRARAIGQPSHQLIQGHFFPAYRATVPVAA